MLGNKVKNTPNKVHLLNCRWKNYCARDFKISLVVVRVLSVDDLYKEVMKRTPLCVELTRKKILKMFGEEDDLKMDNFRESLTCPVSIE